MKEIQNSELMNIHGGDFGDPNNTVWYNAAYIAAYVFSGQAGSDFGGWLYDVTHS